MSLTRREFVGSFVPLPLAPTFAPIVGRWADLCQLRRKSLPSVWAEENVYLPETVTSDPGPLKLKRTPYLIEPLNAIVDPETERETLIFGTQIGKTLLIQLDQCYISVECPSPAGLFGPNLASIRKLRDKYRLLCEASSAIRSVAPGPREWNDISINFRNSITYLGYAGSTQSLSGETCRYVFKTELDRWRNHDKQGSSSAKADERTKNWSRSFILQESTPTNESSEICAQYELSDKRLYLVPCPTCGHFQELRFFKHKEGPFTGRGQIMGLQDAETGKYLPSDVVHKTAWYECEAEGCRIESWQKQQMLERGVWCPGGQTVNKKGELEGTPDRPPRHRGYRLSSLYSPKLTFGAIAAKYLDSRDDRAEFQVFWNDWLALQWFNKAEPPQYKRVARRLAASHSRGTVPQAAFFITIGADTQDDCVYWVARAWGEGSRSWLVDCGRLDQRHDAEGKVIPSSDLNQLDEVLDRDWPLIEPNPIGRKSLRARLMNIDMQGHRQWEVFQWARERQAVGAERIRLIAGDNRVAASSFFERGAPLERARDGKEYPGGLVHWRLNVDVYKEDVRKRFDMPLESPGAWFLFEGILGKADDYLRQICNESKRLSKNKRGREVVEWLENDKRVGNHYWDCEIYARAASDMVVGHDWKDLLGQATGTSVIATSGEEAVPQRVSSDDYSAR